MKIFFNIIYAFIICFVPLKTFGAQPDQLVYRLIAKCSKNISKKYNIDAIGSDISMPDNVIKMVGASFQNRKISSIEEGRKIVLTSAKEFLDAANADEKIRPYLFKHPLTINDIEVTIYFRRDQPFDDEGNQIRVVSIERGIVYFKFENKVPTRGYSKMDEETYSEALKKLQTKPTPSKI